MKNAPIINKIEVIAYESSLENLGKDYNTFNLVYKPNSKMVSRNNILRIHTDQGLHHFNFKIYPLASFNSNINEISDNKFKSFVCDVI